MLRHVYISFPHSHVDYDDVDDHVDKYHDGAFFPVEKCNGNDVFSFSIPSLNERNPFLMDKIQILEVSHVVNLTCTFYVHQTKVSQSRLVIISVQMSKKELHLFHFPVHKYGAVKPPSSSLSMNVDVFIET